MVLRPRGAAAPLVGTPEWLGAFSRLSCPSQFNMQLS